MKWKLFLDDVREPNWVGAYFTPGLDFMEIARSYKDAVNLIGMYGCPNFVYFDHDLAPDHYGDSNPDSKYETGYDFAKWLVYKDLESFGKFIPEDFAFSCHSMNPAGKQNIESLMGSYLYFKKHEVQAEK